MNRLIITAMFVVLSACDVQTTVPANAKRCSSDVDCDDGEYCGFYGVDTKPVCKPTPHKFNHHWQ